MVDVSKHKKKQAMPDLQEELEEIEHTAEQHARECGKEVEDLLKEIEQKEEEIEEGEHIGVREEREEEE